LRNFILSECSLKFTLPVFFVREHGIKMLARMKPCRNESFVLAFGWGTKRRRVFVPKIGNQNSGNNPEHFGKGEICKKLVSLAFLGVNIAQTKTNDNKKQQIKEFTKR